MAGERTLPGLGLTGFWDLGSAYKTQMDENLRRLSLHTQPFLTASLASPPGSPTDGAIYRATSAWSGVASAGQIVVRDNGAWVAYTPQEGWEFWDRAADAKIRFDGTSWAAVGAGGIADAPADDGTYARKNGAWTNLAEPQPNGVVANFDTNSAAATASNSDFATKGNVVVPQADRFLTGVTFIVSGSTPTQTVSLFVAEVDAGNLVTEVLLNVGVVSVVNPATGTVFSLPTPIRLRAGRRYAIAFVRTGGSGTSPLIISYPVSGAAVDANSHFTLVDRGGRLASNAPTIGSNMIDASLAAGSSCDMVIRSEGALALSGGGAGGAGTALKHFRLRAAPGASLANTGAGYFNFPFGTTTAVFGGGDYASNTNSNGNQVIIPSGVTRAVISAGYRLSVNNTCVVEIFIQRSTDGGSTWTFLAGHRHDGVWNVGVISTGVIPVSAGERYRVAYFSTAALALDADATFFSVQQVPEAVGGGGGSEATPITHKTVSGSYTLLNSDLAGNVYITADTSGGACTITVPSGLTGREPVAVERNGTNAVTFVAGSGATIRSADSHLKLRVDASVGTLVPKGSNGYTLSGDLAA